MFDVRYHQRDTRRALEPVLHGRGAYTRPLYKSELSCFILSLATAEASTSQRSKHVSTSTEPQVKSNKVTRCKPAPAARQPVHDDGGDDGERAGRFAGHGRRVLHARRQVGLYKLHPVDP